eukprot:GEMP01002103.1.p1 GENE.GEMP01002103.1~~GEMP01002103.1.p1  ORF type:complete len:1425 (+),score=385.03 GEMP01002103.1:216-4490(+)
MPAEGEILGEPLPPGVDGDVQGQLCIEVLHAPENLRFRWWGMRSFSTFIPSKKPPSNPHLSHAIRTTPDCFACYVRDGDPTLEIERESAVGVSTPINLRPFLRGMDLVLDASLPLSDGHEVHLRITTFWNARDLVNSFEKNEQLARDMVDESMELRAASMQQRAELTRNNGPVTMASSIGLASMHHTGAMKSTLSDGLTTKPSPRTRSPLPTVVGKPAPAADTVSSTMPAPMADPRMVSRQVVGPARPDALDSLHERARRLQMKTTECVEPVVQAQLEDLLASDPMYSVKNTPAVSSNARVSPSKTRGVVEHNVSKPGAAVMTIFVDWISLRRGMPQQASALQLVVEYDGRGTKGARRQVAQFWGKQLVPPDRVVIQDAQTIALEGIPPVITLRLEGKNIAAEAKLAWSTVSRAQQFLVHLQPIVAASPAAPASSTASAKKTTTPKAVVPRPAPYGMVSLVCSVEQHHLLVVLHRLELKKPARVQMNFKLGPDEEVTTPGFCDELNFATVSQDPVTLDAIVFEVWAFPRADLIGLCKVPIPLAESTLRSELFSWDTGEVIGALELTLRRAPKAQLHPFLTPKAKPHDGNKQQEGDSSNTGGVSEWLQVGCAGMGRVLVAAKLGELKSSLSCEELLQVFLDHCLGVTRNEALVLVCTIVRHFRGELRGIAPALKSWTEPLEDASIPGSFVSFWIDSRQRLALETIKRLVPQPTPGLIREGASSWDLVEGMFKALDEFGSNEIDAWVFSSLVLRHEENVVQMHLAAQSDLLEFLQAIAADDKVASVTDFFFGFVVHDHFVHKSAFAHVAQRLISEQQAARLAEFLATPEGVDVLKLEALLSKKDEQMNVVTTGAPLVATDTSVAKECLADTVKNNVAAIAKDDEHEENASISGQTDGRLARLSSEWERAPFDGNMEFLPSQSRTFHLRSSIDRDADSLVRCGPSSLPAHPGAKALCLDFLAKLVCGEIPVEIAHAVLNDAARLLHRGSHVAVAAWQTLTFSTSPEAARTALRAFSERDPSHPDAFIVTEERLREAIDAFPLLDAELDDIELHEALRDLEDAEGFIHAQDLSKALDGLDVPFPADYATKLRYSNVKQRIRRRGSSPARHDISVDYPLHAATSDQWRIPRSRCFDFPPYITFALLTYTPAASSSGGGASDTVRGKLFHEFLTYILGLDKAEAGAILKSLDVTKTSSQISYKDWRRYFEGVDYKRRQKLLPQQSLSLLTLRQQIRQMLDFADISVAPFLDEALESQGVTRESGVSWEVLKRVLAHLRLPNLESKDIVEWGHMISRFRELPSMTYGDMVAWLSHARSFLARHLDDFFGALLVAPDGPVDLDVLFPTSTNASAEEFLGEIRRVCGWDTEALPRRYEEALEVLESDGLRGVFLPEVKQMYRHFCQRNGTILRSLQKCMKEYGETTASLFRQV